MLQSSSNIYQQPQLQGEIGPFTVHRKLNLSTLNNHYLVIKTSQTYSVSPNYYILKSYGKRSAYQTEMQVYKKVYQNDEMLKNHFIEGGKYITFSHQQIFCTISNYCKNGNLFNFLMMVNKKVSQKCCRYYLFSILTTLLKIKRNLGVIHCAINLQNILVSTQKLPIIVGWSHQPGKKTEAEVIYDCVDVFCSMLTGCPPLKKNSRKSFLSVGEWKKYEKSLQKMVGKAIGGETYRILGEFLELSLVNEINCEKTNLLTFEKVLKHPYLSMIPDPQEVSQELSKLQKQYKIKQQQKIQQDILKKAKRQQIILEHRNNLNTMSFNDSHNSSLVSDYDSFDHQLCSVLNLQKVDQEDRQDIEEIQVLKTILSSGKRQQQQQNSEKQEQEVEVPKTERQLKSCSQDKSTESNERDKESIEELKRMRIKALIQKVEKGQQESRMQNIIGCIKNLFRKNRKNSEKPCCGIYNVITMENKRQNNEMMVQIEKKENKMILIDDEVRKRKKQQKKVKKQIIFKLNIISFCLANLKLSLRQLVECKTIFISQFLLNYYSVEKMNVGKFMMEADLNLELQQADFDKILSPKYHTQIGSRTNIHTVILHICINFTINSTGKYMGMRNYPQKIKNTQIEVKQSSMHEFHNLQLIQFFKEELAIQNDDKPTE